MEKQASESSKGKKPRLSAKAAMEETLFSLVVNDDKSCAELKRHTAGLVQSLVVYATESRKAQETKLAVAVKELETITARKALMQLELQLIEAKKGSPSSSSSNIAMDLDLIEL